jgi:hypothetical protein
MSSKSRGPVLSTWQFVAKNIALLRLTIFFYLRRAKVHHLKMNLKRLIVRLHVLIMVSLLFPQASKAGYAEEAIQVKPAGFTISQVTHDFSAGQIIVDAEISADPSMVTLLYLPRPNASAAFADSFDVRKHPCELSKNDPCCLNALVSDYQVAPEMAGLFHHSDLCPASGVSAVVGNSLANPALGAVLYPIGIAGAGLLSSGGAPGSYTYDDRVSYSATPVGTDKYAIELRFPHAYIADRAIVSAVGGGIKQYEFFVGASFVKLLSYSSLIDVKTIQTNVHYNKADYLFTSVSSEQQRLAFDGINVFLHQARSQLTNKLYQYLELHLDWNETLYPPASATVMQDSLVLAKHTAHSTAASWLEPCTANTGYYYTAAEKANVDALALETCLPSQPTWCAFAGTRFFLPLPPDSATSTDGWITAADAANQLFVDFVLRLTTPQGDSVFSNVYLSIDLASLVPLAHCDENKFLFVSVADIVKIQAHVGVQHANDSYTTLNQTSTTNSIAYEIAENQNVVASGRRLLQAPATTEDFSCDATLLMRYAFDDPANPGIDSVSGNSAGITGDVTVADGYATFNGGAVRLQPLIVGENTDITFSWWMNPSVTGHSTNAFRIGGSNEESRIQWYFSTAFSEWRAYVRTPGSDFVWVGVGVDKIPYNSDQWVFISWSIQASDGLWSIVVDDTQVINQLVSKLHPKTYDEEWHFIGENAYGGLENFYGHVDDFRVYQSFFSPEQVAAVRAGGPASTCAAPVDFSCDATLLMRYAFDDPANPGIDSVSGSTAGVTGTVTIQDNAYAEFDAATSASVRMQPFTVAAGDDVTFSWWMRPDSAAKAQASGERGVFQMGSNSAANQIRWRWKNSDATVWYPQIRSSGTWAYVSISGVQADVWSFVMWRIRADGYWSVIIDDEEKYSGVQQTVASQLYDGTIHHIGISNNNPTYPGGLRDFRLYRSFLSDEQVAAVRAGGPASTCAAPVDFSCDATLFMRYAFDDPANPGIDSVSGNSAGISGAVSVQDSYAVFNGGTVRLEPLTVLEGEDISFCFWLNAAVTTTTNVFKIGFDANDGRMQLYYNHAALLWQPYVKLPGSGWIYVDIQSSDIPRNSDTWVFVSWSIRASDGLWSIWVDDTEIINSITSPVHPKTYNDDWHHIGQDNFYGSIDDFRIYRTFLSSDQVAAVRAGGPATACAASSSSSPPKKKQKVQKVKATMSLPLTVEQFNEDVQLEYRTTIAAVAGVAVAQVQIVSITASGGGSRRLLQSGGVDVETEIEDDGSGSLEAVEEVLTEEAVNTYIEESGSTTLPTLTMSELTTEVVFFDIPTLGNFSGALSYSDAAIGISFDMTEFIQEASWAAGMRYRVDDAILFNFLNLGANASSFYPTLRDAVRNKTLFSIERAEGSGIHHLQMNLPPEVLCDEVTTQGANTMLSAANLDCFYRRAIVDDVVQPAASESVFFYRKNNDEEAARDFIERNMLGSDSEWANETASAYFNRVCPGSLDASATTNTYGCIFADPGYRWLSRHAFSGLDSFLLSDKTILVLLVSVLDASGNVFRRRLLSQDDLEGGIFADHAYTSRRNDGQRSLLQLRDDQTEQVLSRLKSESVDSSVAFETSQTSGAAKAAVMKGLGGSRWQLIAMQGLKETWVSPNTYMRNLKVMLQHVTSFFTKSLRGIEIVSARVRKNGAGGGTSAAGRRLLSTGNSSSEGETDTVDVLGLLRISDFTGAPVYEQEISCVFSELASTGRNLTFQEQFELLLNCQMMREGVFSYPANLSLRECGMGAATLDSRDCLAISLRREMARPSLAASDGNSGNGVSAAWVVVSIVLLSVAGIGILVQGTRQKIVVVAHQADPFVIIDEKIPLHPMHQPVLALKEQNI